jgi:DtxR family Mn-dependent transcriptional regulator
VEKEELSPTVENYLKAILELGEGGESAAVGEVAEHMGVAPASVTLMFRSLAEKELVRYAPYQGARLTAAGRHIALRIIRRHRLVERYLVDVLGLSWDEVHAEAEKWEHVLSARVEERMAQQLGDPGTDPHGAPIPSLKGALHADEMERLDQIQPGEKAYVGEIYDRDPELLRYLDELGIKPGVEVECRAREPFGGSLKLMVQGIEQDVGLGAAKQIKAISIDASAESEANTSPSERE